MSAESTGDGTNGVCGQPDTLSLSKAFQPPRPSPSPLSENPAKSGKTNGGDQAYSVFTRREKWLIVGIASYAALFRRVESYLVYLSRRSLKLTNSPLTANIYFPAIPVISRDFHKSIELINLTVTMYMVMQGICVSLSQHLRAVLTARYWLDDVAPMIWGTLSDRWGRRPMMFGCLATLSLSCIGLALVPTSAYWLLMLLRCLQAAGSASTIALGMYLVRQASWFGMLIMAQALVSLPT